MKIAAAFFATFLFVPPLFAAEIPRALPEGELPKDARLGPLKDLDGYFPFTVPESREAWAKRADEVRMQMRVALGLWPEPTRTPLNAVIHGRIEREDFTVEKVFFESMPGFFVTGTLYRPRTPGPHPAVLCPHGHWDDARWAVRGEAEMKKELASGGERFAEGGRSIFQSLGVQLARMGIVAFNYDMPGYCDSQQIGFALAHKFAKQRAEMNARENWGLFSPQAEAHAQSVMGLQTWNGIRALDFLESLPDVDAKRLGCTGASGGGTQTMMLAALDPRIAVACPAVMVSTAMQGGCTCENASLLRVGTGNVEFAALFAPKPLGMTAANDWTKEMETKGFPELQKLYALMGAPRNVALWPHLEFGHNFNIVSRENIYAFFNEHFHLGLSGDQLREREFPILQKADLTVWDTAHPAPPGGDEFEKKLLKWWNDDAQSQMAKSPEEFEKIARPAWKTAVGCGGFGKFTPTKIEHQREIVVTGLGKQYHATIDMRCAEDGAFATPEIEIKPALHDDRFVWWLDEHGKAGLFAASGELRPEICALLEAKFTVIGIDLFGQGEFLPDGASPVAARVVKNPRESAAYTLGYNPALFAQRAQDVCNAILVPRRFMHLPLVAIVALDGTGPIAAAALATGLSVNAAVIDTHGFRFGDVLDLRDPNFLPAAARYGDVPGALALGVPRALYLMGEGSEAPELVAAVYRRAGAEKKLTLAPKDATAAMAVEWLIGNRDQ